MSDITNDGEHFTKLIQMNMKRECSNLVTSSKANFEQVCKKVLKKACRDFAKISPKSNRKKDIHLKNSFKYRFSEDTLNASILSLGTYNLINWLDHGHYYHTKKGRMFWTGRLKGEYTRLKKGSDNAVIREFEETFKDV